MEGLGILLAIGVAVWFFSKSGEDSNHNLTRGGPSSSLFTKPSKEKSTKFLAIQDGYQPSDRCSCGALWLKRRNSETGGSFFSCSRYPTCRKKRDEVLKQRLGSSYQLYYCSRGHEKVHFGVVYDHHLGKQVCKRCIEKGYVRRPDSV